MPTLRLTMAQALVRFLAGQRAETDAGEVPLFAGVFAIFGHGNVAGLGEALYAERARLPTFRAHNEQAMAHAAIAFAKANMRRRMMACTTSIGPGATNLVSATAVAHVNRLPVLLLPGNVFASRLPDPVLQQVEDFADATITANDCLRPVSRYFDRILRPEQLMASLPAAMETLVDPASCEPVTLALAQDVQTEAYDYPESFFAARVHHVRHIRADASELRRAAEMLSRANKPMIVAGGGVHYALACDALAGFAEKRGIPVAETQAGKGALAWGHPNQVGALGVTGSSAANALAHEADLVLAVGTRLGDFATASRTIFANPECRIIQLNVVALDAAKHGAIPLLADAGRGLEDLDTALGDWQAPAPWTATARERADAWNRDVDKATAPGNAPLATDAQVLGAANRAAGPNDVLVCAAGGLPGELHKLWRTPGPGGYHVEYGYSCMGYEIAGGLGVKMADPTREMFVLVGDGSYLMMNSEIATSVMMDRKLIIVVLDNRGFGCIDRLQRSVGAASFNNLFEFVIADGEPPAIDFAAHAASLSALSEWVSGIAELEEAFERAKTAERTTVIAIATDPSASTEAGGAWWEVAVAEVSESPGVARARKAYAAKVKERTKA